MSGRHATGGIFQARFEYLKQKHGSEGKAEFVKELVHRGYSGPTSTDEFKTANKYPVEMLLLLMQTYMDMYGEQAFDRMARAVAKKRGVVGFYLKWAGTPQLLLEKTPKYWNNYYDFGRMEGEVIDDDHGIIRGYDVSFDPLFCRSTTHYFRGILDSVNTRVQETEQTQCQHHGAEFCQWTIRWH